MSQALTVYALRCPCEQRPTPVLTKAEAAALLRSHRCGAPRWQTWAQPVRADRRPKAFRERLAQAVA